MKRTCFSWIALTVMLAATPAQAASITLEQSGTDVIGIVHRELSELITGFHVDLKFDPQSATFLSGEYGPWLGPLVVGNFDTPFVFGINMDVVHFQQWTPIQRYSYLTAEPLDFPVFTAHFQSLTGTPPVLTIDYRSVNGPVWVPEPASWILVALGAAVLKLLIPSR